MSESRHGPSTRKRIPWAVETMPEILLAFSHGFGEMWHSDMISAFLPPFHANARIFRFDIVLKSSILSQCSSPEVEAVRGRGE